jgi:hypothetical protein
MKRIPVLIPFLVLVSALFIGILIFTYVEAKRANPQMIQVGSIQLQPGLRLFPMERSGPGARLT